MALTWQLPLQVVPGAGFATLTQGSLEEIAQSAALLIDTTPGERRSVPGYGVPGQLGTTRLDPDVIAVAVSQWEPRAEPLQIDVGPITSDGQQAVTISVADDEGSSLT
jgi:phage baseplate assembly protein W